MKSSVVSVDKNLKEQISHGNYAFPVDVRCIDFQAEGNAAPSYFVCHWHPESELMLVLSGAMRYQVNETIYDMKEGEGLFINSNCLHMGTIISGEASTLSVIFHPRFLYGYEDSLIREKYISPILDSAAFPAYSLSSENTDESHVIPGLLLRCLHLYEEKPLAWELHVKASLLSCWGALFALFTVKGTKRKITARSRESTGKAKSILEFIQSHYTQKISLADIADAAALSTGECGRICKRILHQTPFEYLNAYRVEQSIPDLLKKDLSITEIALKHGFSGSSYYAETFKNVRGITPSAFRRSLINSDKD